MSLAAGRGGQPWREPPGENNGRAARDARAAWPGQRGAEQEGAGNGADKVLAAEPQIRNGVVSVAERLLLNA